MARRVKYELVIGFALLAAAGSGIGYTSYNQRTKTAAYQTSVRQQAEAFKAEPERFSRYKTTLDEDQRKKARSEAPKLEKQKKYREAGMFYIKLNNKKKVYEMAAKCQAEGNEEGQKELLREFAKWQDAIKLAEKELKH